MQSTARTRGYAVLVPLPTAPSATGPPPRSTLSPMIFGFAGAGNMARAIALGWARGDGGPENMLFTDSGSGRADALAAEVGGGTRPTIPDLVADSDAIVLAVKPAALDAVATDLRGAGIVVSVLGATSVERLRRALPRATLLRTMPNVAVELRRGVICHASVPDDDREVLAPSIEALSLLGRMVELPEDQLDAATAVMGCMPAYIARVAGAVIDSGERAGLERNLSTSLAADAIVGAGALLASHDATELERSIASPGGSTEAGLDELSARNVAEAFEAAVAGSLERMTGKR